MAITISREDDQVLVRVTLDAPDDPAALATALDALVTATTDLRGLLEVEHGRTRYQTYNVLFDTPTGRLDEQAFFERCVRHPSLHTAMVRYSDNLTEGMVGVSVPLCDGLWHDSLFPAGSFAIVPLALASTAHVPALIRHLRGVDLAHESFHRSLIDRLLTVHGICEPTFDLLVYRAGDGSGGGGGEANLYRAHAHGLRERWAPWGGQDGFAERLHERSEQLADDVEDKDVLASSLAQIGMALCPDDPAAYARWLDRCRALWSIDVDREDYAFDTRGYGAAFAVTEAEWLADWYAFKPPYVER